MGTNAVIYTRISQDRTGSETGVSRQLDDCRALAERDGIEVLKVYSDNDTSAFSRKPRPQFEAMLADAAAGGFDTVIVWAADRLYRRLTDLERIVQVLEAASVQVVTVKSGDINLSTADGRLHARLMGSVAQHESEKKGERVSARARQRATAEGRATTGRRPFGWNFDGTINEPEAVALRDAFEMLLDGFSVSAIARELAGRGLTSTEGGPIKQSKVSDWLRRPRNAGIVTYKGVPVAEGPGIIDRATWDRAQALLADPARRPRKGRPHTTLLGGLLTCASCGGPLKPSSNSVNAGRRILTYACEPHRHVNQSRERLDAMLRDLIAAYVEVNAAAIRGNLDGIDGAAPLRAQAADLREQLSALASLLAAGRLHAADYAAATAAARAKLDDLEARAGEAAGAVATVRVLASDDPGGAVRAMDAPRFRAVVRELVASVTVEPVAAGGSVNVSWREWGA